MLKYRPSLKDQQTEEPENNLLPVLKRNKIFTIASEPSYKDHEASKGYESTLCKNRTGTFESDPQIDDLIHKTKQLLGPVKKEEGSLRKSQKFS